METTTISDDMQFKGEIQFDENLVIFGKVDGVLKGNGNAVVESSGTLLGDMFVRKVEIKGKAQGNLHGSDSVHIFAGGSLSGDIEAKELQMDKGSRHNGSTIMK